MGKLLYNWSEDLVVATNGREMSKSLKNDLERKGIIVKTEPIKSLDGTNGNLEKVMFASGVEIHRKGGFIAPSFYLAEPICRTSGL